MQFDQRHRDSTERMILLSFEESHCTVSHEYFGHLTLEDIGKNTELHSFSNDINHFISARSALLVKRLLNYGALAHAITFNYYL